MEPERLPQFNYHLLANKITMATNNGYMNLVDWNGGMEWWSGLLEWSNGLDYWRGVVIMRCARAFLLTSHSSCLMCS